MSCECICHRENSYCEECCDGLLEELGELREAAEAHIKVCSTWGLDMNRTWKQVWCGLRFHGEQAARVVTFHRLSRTTHHLEHYCARCGHVLLRLELPQ